jgi:hypothetical protein
VGEPDSGRDGTGFSQNEIISISRIFPPIDLFIDYSHDNRIYIVKNSRMIEIQSGTKGKSIESIEFIRFIPRDRR